jgi:hypothetical protein
MINVLRTFIEKNMNLDYFVACLTVAALIITLAQVQEAQQETYKNSSYFPPNNKSIGNQPSAVIIAHKQLKEDKHKKDKKSKR